MIVISGALVLVAAVLLVLGIVSSITLVYAAIGLSIVSAVFLLVGVFQRPAVAPASEARDADTDRTKREAPSQSAQSGPSGKPDLHKDEQEAPTVAGSAQAPPGQQEKEPDPPADAADFPLEAANADYEAKSAATGADVLVVSGRPRYHVGGCEYVEGQDDSEPLEINEARELGFTPCGVCRPHETLALSAAGREHDDHPAPSPAPAPTAAYEPAPAAAVAPTLTPASSTTSSNGREAPPQEYAAAPTTSVPVSEPYRPAAQVPVAPSAPPVALAPLAPPAVAAPTTPPVAETAPQMPDSPTAARARRAGRMVLAVASTKEYHREDCELLEGAASEEITKVAAIRQGYLACGVCKP